MATGWVKSLHCKTNALDDVACLPTTSRKPPLLTSCASSSHALKDAVFLLPKHSTSSSSSSLPKKPKPKPKGKPKSRPAALSASPATAVLAGPACSHPIPTLTELPSGHSSRRVVEIIFSSSWSSGGGSAHAAFPGAIEMLFRVHNPSRTVSRFEEYRSSVRARAARSDDARCAADGNEMMRFHCGGVGGGWVGGAGTGTVRRGAAVASCSPAWSPAGGKAAGIRTFAGSRGAHESGGGGSGRRAMMVCRVIAGRVRGESEANSEGDSVSLGKGELVVFDPRAVLPCFLIIYKVEPNHKARIVI